MIDLTSVELLLIAIVAIVAIVATYVFTGREATRERIRIINDDPEMLKALEYTGERLIDLIPDTLEPRARMSILALLDFLDPMTPTDSLPQELIDLIKEAVDGIPVNTKEATQ